MTYIVSEIQTNSEGVAAVMNFSFTNRNEALSKFFNVLGYAAVSSVPVHTAMIFTEDGRLVEPSRDFKHPVAQPEPEPEPDEDVIVNG